MYTILSRVDFGLVAKLLDSKSVKDEGYVALKV